MVTTGKNLLFLSLGIAATVTDYRVKLSGFETVVTLQNLTQRFGLNNYYIDRRNDRVGYVIKIKTMKYARQLMIQWHNKDIDGQKIKCQLEFNIRSNRVRSPAASTDEEPKHHRPLSHLRYSRNFHNSQETSDLEDIDDIISTSFNNGEANGDHRTFGKVLTDIDQTLSKTNLHHVSSSESITTGIDRKCKFLFLRG